MRRILLSTKDIDQHAADAAHRIATALDISVSPDIKAVALSSVGELRIQIRDLQRQNLELQFLVDVPGFDVQTQLSVEARYIRKCLEDRLPVSALPNRYCYDYFVENYHPEYVLQLCKLLCASCSDSKIPSSDLWEMLIRTSGFISTDIAKNFSPLETDNGIL
jgi:BMFP domain-containing protein YqiC